MANAGVQVNRWAFFLHLSQLLGFVVPLLGLVAPLVVWQLKKADIPELDVHGKIVANWILSEILYAIVFSLLSLVVIGLPFLLALGVVAMVFPIVGAIKANDGVAWKYPFTYAFFK